MERAAVPDTFGLPQDILMDATAAIIAIDHDERVTYLNAIAEERYGCSASSVIGRPLEELYRYEWLTPADADNAYAALADTGVWHGRNVHVLRSGRRIVVDSLVRVVNRPDAPLGMVAVIRPLAA